MTPRTRTVGLLPALLCLLVATFGAALAASPAAAADDDFAFKGTYLRTADNGCDSGDVPIFGGHYSSGGDPLLHWHPVKDGERGTWESAANGTLYKSVICLDFVAGVPWHVVDESWTPGTDSGAAATCPLGEQLLGGGFYFPSGLQGATTANAPDGSRAWGVAGGGDPRASNTAYAVCAKLPAGFSTYAAEASRSDAGEVAAHCKGGDLPLSGGWDGAQVRANRPEAGGWLVEYGAGGGFARAVCLSGVAKRLEQRAVYGAHPYLNAECAESEFAVNAGWDTGAGMQDLRVFLPWNSSTRGWTIASNEGNSSSSLAWVLCAKVVPPPAPTWTEARLPWAAGLGVLGLLALGGLLLGRGTLGVPVKAVVGVGAGAAVTGAVIVALLPIGDASVAKPGDSDAFALPTDKLPVSASPSPSASASTSSSASASASASASPSPSASPTKSPSATPTKKATPKPTPKAITSSAAPPPPPAPVVDFRVPTTALSMKCKGETITVPPGNIALDNSRSNQAVSWSATASDLSNGSPWASLSPASGTVAAGGGGSIGINPKAYETCRTAQLNGGSASFTVRVTGGGRTATVTVSVAWVNPIS